MEAVIFGLNKLVFLACGPFSHSIYYNIIILLTMAGFNTKTFKKNDDYMTPKYAWENIKDLIPKDKIIWEAFYGDGKSGDYLTELGFEVIHKEIDFFENILCYQLI
jgi:hypothetical protein